MRFVKNPNPLRGDCYTRAGDNMCIYPDHPKIRAMSEKVGPHRIFTIYKLWEVEVRMPEELNVPWTMRAVIKLFTKPNQPK